MAFSAPPAIPEAIQQAATHFWEVALATARVKIAADLAAERSALEAAQGALSDERAALASEAQRSRHRRRAGEEAMHSRARS
jgi:hypothetical protein